MQVFKQPVNIDNAMPNKKIKNTRLPLDRVIIHSTVITIVDMLVLLVSKDLILLHTLRPIAHLN